MQRVAGLLMLLVFVSGCGYTTGSLLPPHIKNIYIEGFANSIPLTEESSGRQRYKTYRPRLEKDITQALIDKFIFDGHLKVTRKKDADVIVEGELKDFRREPTKYGHDDDIEQYRIAIIVDIMLKDIKNDEVLWHESNFAGSDLYYTTGSQIKSEDAAVTDAVDDLARRIVERTIEVW
ncbi:LPS assembly lipoprotein LptE [Candidatus Omnitrophota bacterium]